jgi:hypothetical protein
VLDMNSLNSYRQGHRLYISDRYSCTTWAYAFQQGIGNEEFELEVEIDL